MGHRWTWEKLAQSATRLNPKTRGRNYPYVPKYELQKYTSGPNRGKPVIVPYVGTKSVLISLRAWGVTQASIHSITLQFSDCEILTENPNDAGYFSCEYDDQFYWIKKLDRRSNPLTSRCSCRDYVFSFSIFNYKQGCLYGPPPKPFRRKTNRKPRNPGQFPGICKHVYYAWNLLKSAGLTIN